MNILLPCPIRYHVYNRGFSAESVNWDALIRRLRASGLQHWSGSRRFWKKSCCSMAGVKRKWLTPSQKRVQRASRLCSWSAPCGFPCIP